MKQGIMKWILLCLSGLFILGLGVGLGNWNAIKNMQSEEVKAAEKSTSDRIAIVNLDEGDMVIEENIIYASHILPKYCEP